MVLSWGRGHTYPIDTLVLGTLKTAGDQWDYRGENVARTEEPKGKEKMKDTCSGWKKVEEGAPSRKKISEKVSINVRARKRNDSREEGKI